jgi:F0F1-type ATP synthase membrane subunit b/b'
MTATRAARRRGGGANAPCLETAAVLGGSDLERAQERAPHRLGGAEAAGAGDGGDRLGAVLEQPAGGLEPHALDPAGGRDAGLGAEGAGEVARAHVCALGHGLDAVIAGDVLDDASLHLAQRLALGLLGGERGAELRLVAGAAEEQDEVAGDGQRELAVVVVLDQRQREIHPGGDACGGPHVTVAHEDRIGVDGHVGVAAGERLGGGPVGGGAAAVEQAGGGEQEGAGADGCCASGASRGSGDPAQQRLVAHGGARAVAAGDDQRVDGARRLRERPVGDERETARGAHGGAVDAERADLVAVGVEQPPGAGEDLDGAADVEALHTWKEQDHDLAGGARVGHAAIMTHGEFVRKDRYPTISAIRSSIASAAAGPQHPCHRADRAVYHGPMERSVPGSEGHEAEREALDSAPARVAGIVEAAERTAAELREQAEARARERIAEADRAAANRVRAAEEESEELLREARAQAEAARNEAVAAVGSIHAEAERVRGEAQAEAERLRAAAQAEIEAERANARAEAELERSGARDQTGATLAGARTEAERIVEEARAQAGELLAEGQSEAERARASGGEDLEKLRAQAHEQAQAVRAKAREDAREIVGESHTVAREVLREGTELSRNLRELSVSLRNNAERLLRDVRLAHGSMTARLDQAGPGASVRPASSRTGLEEPDEDLDVPEFIPPE